MQPRVVRMNKSVHSKVELGFCHSCGLSVSVLRGGGLCRCNSQCIIFLLPILGESRSYTDHEQAQEGRVH